MAVVEHIIFALIQIECAGHKHIYMLFLCRSAWNTWQAKLQQHYNVYALEDQALQHWALMLQSRVTM